MMIRDQSSVNKFIWYMMIPNKGKKDERKCNQIEKWLQRFGYVVQFFYMTILSKYIRYAQKFQTSF